MPRGRANTNTPDKKTSNKPVLDPKIDEVVIKTDPLPIVNPLSSAPDPRTNIDTIDITQSSKVEKIQETLENAQQNDQLPSYVLQQNSYSKKNSFHMKIDGLKFKICKVDIGQNLHIIDRDKNSSAYMDIRTQSFDYIVKVCDDDPCVRSLYMEINKFYSIPQITNYPFSDLGYSVVEYGKNPTETINGGMLHAILSDYNDMKSTAVTKGFGLVNAYVKDVYTTELPASQFSGSNSKLRLYTALERNILIKYLDLYDLLTMTENVKKKKLYNYNLFRTDLASQYLSNQEDRNTLVQSYYYKTFGSTDRDIETNYSEPQDDVYIAVVAKTDFWRDMSLAIHAYCEPPSSNGVSIFASDDLVNARYASTNITSQMLKNIIKPSTVCSYSAAVACYKKIIVCMTNSVGCKTIVSNVLYPQVDWLLPIALMIFRILFSPNFCLNGTDPTAIIGYFNNEAPASMTNWVTNYMSLVNQVSLQVDSLNSQNNSTVLNDYTTSTSAFKQFFSATNVCASLRSKVTSPTLVILQNFGSQNFEDSFKVILDSICKTVSVLLTDRKMVPARKNNNPTYFDVNLSHNVIEFEAAELVSLLNFAYSASQKASLETPKITGSVTLMNIAAEGFRKLKMDFIPLIFDAELTNKFFNSINCLYNLVKYFVSEINSTTTYINDPLRQNNITIYNDVIFDLVSRYLEVDRQTFETVMYVIVDKKVAIPAIKENVSEYVVNMSKNTSLVNSAKMAERKIFSSSYVGSVNHVKFVEINKLWYLFFDDSPQAMAGSIPPYTYNNRNRLFPTNLVVGVPPALKPTLIDSYVLRNQFIDYSTMVPPLNIPTIRPVTVDVDMPIYIPTPTQYELHELPFYCNDSSLYDHLSNTISVPELTDYLESFKIMQGRTYTKAAPKIKVYFTRNESTAKHFNAFSSGYINTIFGVIKYSQLQTILPVNPISLVVDKHLTEPEDNTTRTNDADLLVSRNIFEHNQSVLSSVSPTYDYNQPSTNAPNIPREVTDVNGNKTTFVRMFTVNGSITYMPFSA